MVFNMKSSMFRKSDSIRIEDVPVTSTGERQDLRKLLMWHSTEKPIHVSPQNESTLDALKDIREQMDVLRSDMFWTKKNIRVMMKNVESIKKSTHTMVQKIDDAIAEEITDDNYNMTLSQIQDLILETVDRDKPFYPSDVAMEYGLDFDKVDEAIDMLRKEGRIIDRD